MMFMTLRKLHLVAIAACLAAAAPASAQSVPKPASVEVVTVAGLGSATILTYKAQFVSADPATRRVVLEVPSGER